LPSCSTSCHTNDLQVRPRRSCTGEAGHGTAADFLSEESDHLLAVGRGEGRRETFTVCFGCWRKTFAHGEAAPHFSGHNRHVASGGALSNCTFGCAMRQGMFPACSSVCYSSPFLPCTRNRQPRTPPPSQTNPGTWCSPSFPSTARQAGVSAAFPRPASVWVANFVFAKQAQR
jgi:hypothetical protein